MDMNSFENQKARWAWDKVAGWSDQLDTYFTSLCARAADKTVTYEMCQIVPMARWAAQKGIALGDYSRKHLEQYNMYRQSEGISDRTRYHCAVCCKRMFAWLVEEDYLSKDEFARYKCPKVPEAHVAKPSIDDLKKLFRTFDGKSSEGRVITNQSPKTRAFHLARERAIISILVDTAARIGEVLSITMDMYKPGERQIIYPVTKGKKPRTVPISPALVQIIDTYLKVRPKVEGRDLLFISNTGDQLQVEPYGRLFGKYVKQSGIDRITLHGIRHYSLSEIAKTDLWAAVGIAGHKDAKTTMIYSRHDADHLRVAHAAAAPLGKILVEERQMAKRKKRII